MGYIIARACALIFIMVWGTWEEITIWIKWVLFHRKKITYYEYKRFDDLAENYDMM